MIHPLTDTTHPIASRTTLVVLAGLLLLPGCGKKAEAPAAAPAAAPQPSAAPAAKPTTKGASEAPVVDDKAADKALAPQEASGAPALTGKGGAALADVQVSLRFDPAKPKVGQLFRVTTVVTRGGKPQALAGFSVDSTMPAHGHGMMTKPVHKPVGPGVFLTEGFKLHMHGKWVFEVKGTVDGQPFVAKMPWEQPPEAL